MFTGFDPAGLGGPRGTSFIMSREESVRRALDRRARAMGKQFMARGLPIMPLVNQPFINLFKGPTTRLFDEPFLGGGAGGAIDVIEAARQFNPFRRFIEILATGRP